MRVIARKHNLYGSSDAERAVIDMCADQIMDMRNGFVRLCYNPKFNDLKADYLKKLPDTLKLYEEFIGDKKFLIGDNVSFPDFHLYEMLDQHTVMEPTCLDGFPKLQAYK